jgi:hypothetical protein
MAVRDDRGDVKQTTTGFRGPLMVQSLTSAKSKFLSLVGPACAKETYGEVHITRPITTALLLLTLIAYPFPVLPNSSADFDAILQQIPSEEGNRFRQIIVGVMRNNPTFITDEAHTEFWSILDRWASLDPRATKDSNKAFEQYMRAYFGGGVRTYGRVFWEDALWAVTNGQTFKSQKREEFEEDLYKKGEITKFQIKENERKIERIARGQPILVNGEDIILDKELILELLGTLEETAKRVERLFTR